jgi:hypothetical protein
VFAVARWHTKTGPVDDSRPINDYLRIDDNTAAIRRRHGRPRRIGTGHLAFGPNVRLTHRKRPLFSIIICSHRPVRATFIQRHYEALFREHPHEVIMIEDATSLCEGYTRGARTSTGDKLVFSHDDIEFVTPDVALRLERHLAQFDVVGIAGTTRLINGAWVSAGDPHCFAVVIYPQPDELFAVKCVGAGALCVPGMQALDGCFFACRREVAESVGFDAATFDDFHLYDLDFTYGAYLKGFRLAVCRDLALIHASTGRVDETWMKYRLRFEAKYRAQLPKGAPGKVRELRARLPRERLAGFCEPEALARMIERLG